MKHTREKIINAVFRIASRDKTKNKLTLAEIAQEAGISRQAIYQKHFQTTDEIFEYIHEEIDDQVRSAFSDKVLINQDISLFFDRVASELLPVIYEHREWLKILYSSEIDLKWRKYLIDNYSNLTVKYLEENNFCSTYLSTPQTVKIMTDYTISIISVWITEDVPMLPSVFSKVFLGLMNATPNNLLTKK